MYSSFQRLLTKANFYDVISGMFDNQQNLPPQSEQQLLHQDVFAAAIIYAGINPEDRTFSIPEIPPQNPANNTVSDTKIANYGGLETIFKTSVTVHKQEPMSRPDGSTYFVSQQRQVTGIARSIVRLNPLTGRCEIIYLLKKFELQGKGWKAGTFTTPSGLANHNEVRDTMCPGVGA